MTTAISLAYSTIDMFKKDKLLVRKLESIEEMGQVNELLIGKTGTLTTEQMTVTNIYIQTLSIINSRKNTINNTSALPDQIDLLKESVCFNCMAHVEISDDARYIPVGNGTDVSLLNWLQDAEIDIHHAMIVRDQSTIASVPFNTNYKRMITAIRHPNHENLVRVYIKGAHEEVTRRCSYAFDHYGQRIDLGDETYGQLNNFVHEQCQQGLRLIAFAYKDLSEDQWSQIIDQTGGDFSKLANIKLLEEGADFIGFVSLNDPLRPHVKNVVQYAQRGHMNVRMISADNLETAINVAYNAGILTEEEINDPQREKFAIDATQLRELVGELVDEPNAEGQTIEHPSNMEAFKEIMSTLKVIGRAGSDDKHLVTAGLQNLSHCFNNLEGPLARPRKVAVVGEGMNDVRAFRAAHVSLAMGSGASYTKNNASMVLVTDEFESALRGIMWGRNIYTNIKRFLQFQVTINLSVILIILIGYGKFNASAFGVVNLLWINLIMDTLGALALATLPPSPSVIKQEPITDGVQIMDAIIWRQVWGIGLYQTLFCTFAIWFGPWLYYNVGDYANDTDSNSTDEQGQHKKMHMTLVYNTFVWMCIFNMMNCRVVGVRDFNVFANFTASWTYIAVLIFIIVIQVLATGDCGAWNTLPHLFVTSEISWSDQYTCIVSAATVLLASFILKLTPEEWFTKHIVTIDENKVYGEGTALMNFYDKQAAAKLVAADDSFVEDEKPFDQDDSYQAA